MKSPILFFTKKDKLAATILPNNGKLYWGKNLLLRSDEWNTNLTIIDSEGKILLINKILSSGKISILESIKSFGIMVEAILEIEDKYEYAATISLEELKERCYLCVSKNKKFWSPINDGRGLKRMIYEAKDYKELIMMFR